jgi:hypothetical protein
MTPLVTLSFTLRLPDGRPLELAVDADTALIGSGAHCEIRLSPDDCPIEQMFVEARAGGVFGQARSMNPPALLNGVPFTQGRLLPESILQIGRVQVSVSLSQLSTEPAARKTKQRRTSPITYLAALVGFPLGFYALFTLQKKPAGLPKAVDPPVLFADAEGRRPCPQQAPGAAAALADSQTLLADAKSERAPFDPKDGVAASDLYELAASCFKVAGAKTEAEQAKASAAAMRETMSEDFHTHRIRLERALATKDYDSARTEVNILLDFMDRDPEREQPKGATEYTTWLSTMDRQIELKFASKKKRK